MPALTNDEMVALQKRGHGRDLYRRLACPRCGQPADTPRLPVLTRCPGCAADFGYGIDDALGTPAIPRCPACRLGHMLPAIMNDTVADQRRIIDIMDGKKRHPLASILHPAVRWVYARCVRCGDLRYVCVSAPPAIEKPPEHGPPKAAPADAPTAARSDQRGAAPATGASTTASVTGRGRCPWWRFWR